jgi:hypothetical protein
VRRIALGQQDDHTAAALDDIGGLLGVESFEASDGKLVMTDS